MNSIVIGSGPSGVACSHALLARGYSVTLIDTGITLEPEIEQKVERLSDKPTSTWTSTEVDAIRSTPQMRGGQLESKTVFGSQFPYAKDTAETFVQVKTACLQSYARGGLSNVWGAATLPAASEDIGPWPFSLEALKPHYDSVSKFMALTSDHPTSIQAAAILEHVNRNVLTLKDHGWWVRKSTLALKMKSDSQSRACESLGLCLTGCPLSSIYNSAQTLNELKKHPHFKLESEFKVQKIIENSQENSVEIQCRNLTTHTSQMFRADTVFLGAGVLSTLQIMSQSAPDTQPSAMEYNPYFLVPLFLFKGFRNLEREKSHALSQIFIEINDPRLSKHRVHLQIYTYNRTLKDLMKQKLRAFGPLSEPLANFLLRRIIFLQGYFHSKDTLPIQVQSASGRHRLESNADPKLNATLKKVMRQLFRLRSSLGFIPIPFLAHLGKPGEGNHIGGTFPMQENPKPGESDTLGRPFGFSRLHIIDASVLPSLPGTTITYTVMANAHRIGSLA